MWSNDCGLLSGYDDDERIRNDLRIDQKHTRISWADKINGYRLKIVALTCVRVANK